ncbi:hypothetical protein F2Q65_14045 [Thiohalocapsa marina]|uniref:Serine acetyltransferase n=1 Tax=Thiohalocapsa marina TaxID=424902 RepID=A0A5M8FGT1_9GAMM|nr:hypothetical protein [Thiohalocapsa marina]KAA6183927.1 hypothetical protein F2Q65_14045 [Thiohalocapsa marina]
MKRAEFSEILLARLGSEVELDEEEVMLLEQVKVNAFECFLENHNSINNKYSDISVYNVDQCIHFFIFLQKLLFQEGFVSLAEKIYYFTRLKFNIDIYPSRRLPQHFLFVHPLGSILGNASYGDWLVIYQGVTVGGNPNLEYPSLGGGCILYAGSKVIGRSVVGKNCIVGAGVILNNVEIPDNTIVYLDGRQIRRSKSNSRENRSRYFK